MMPPIDLQDLQSYIGAEDVRSDTVRADALAQFRGTLETHLVGEDISAIPPGFHWTMYPPLTPTRELREDGHPASLGLLPELPFSSRMWAGGEVTFSGALNVGDKLDRRSRVASIDLKSGSSGPLLFVKLDHEIIRQDEVVIEETQTIVYREPPTSQKAPEQAAEAASDGNFAADSRLLFRYSALTFNTHRIHYDERYARDVEGYPGLVVHGPLQATLLLNAIAKRLGHPEFRFSYRGVAPLFAGQGAELFVDGQGAEVRRGSGDTTMKAQFTPLVR